MIEITESELEAIKVLFEEVAGSKRMHACIEELRVLAELLEITAEEFFVATGEFLVDAEPDPEDYEIIARKILRDV